MSNNNRTNAFEGLDSCTLQSYADAFHGAAHKPTATAEERVDATENLGLVLKAMNYEG